MSPWHAAARRNSTAEIKQLIASHRGTMLHQRDLSVCLSCPSRSADHGVHWGSCSRCGCANYGSRWNGNTALHDASAAGHVEAAALLLECGAHVDATNKHGRTPLDVARGEAVAALLRAHGGVRGEELRAARGGGEGAAPSPRARPAVSSLNAATLSGAIDVVAVRWPDGEVRSSALHVRFGKLLAPFAKGRRVTVHINSMPCAIALELGQEGDASYRPTAAELAALGLRLGINHVEYRCDGRPVVARLYLLECHEKVIISDIDGTITRYDLLGHVPVAVARLARINQFHRGVCAFFERCASNGYHLLYLTARPAGMAARTLELLASAHEDGHRLPRGPLILSPSRTFEALDRELVRKIPHLFKISALSDIRSLWPETQNPFSGTVVKLDSESSQEPFASYADLLPRVDLFFPPIQPAQASK
ncbi:hypothetical protein AB1Y20_000319 [Prymnesium parvum]|uniref:LNS2/PITP domain-containing protein n=1 Tax=Prymnesium parvum TaxID=97485 RepID=A0AB34K869_PRYPA